jgi:5-methylthioadenosine/S-adenosylhomocysteine deaminase
MSTLLVSGGTILTSDDANSIIENGYVLVDGNRIVEVGTGEPSTSNYEQVIDASGMLVCPGFINAHTHLCMIFGRSLGSDRSLLHWLSDSQIPLARALNREDYALSMQLGAIENIKAGNTTICEVFFCAHYADAMDEVCVAALELTGIRSIFCRCSNDETFFDGFIETRQDILNRSQSLIRNWKNHDRVQIGIGPIVPWASSADGFVDAVGLSQENNVLLHLHTAETPEYNDLVRSRTGKSNVEMLADVGALGDRVMLNHCVHLSENDINLIAETGSHVIHDPTSNMLLASGVAPIPQLRSAGINIALACDGPACNNTQDMIQVMKDAALLQKVVSRQADALIAKDVFTMATRGGARAIGMGSSLGSIQPGFLADIILINTEAPHLTPMHDPMATLVYSARGSDIHTVIINGQMVMHNRIITTVDEKEILVKARERAVGVRQRAGL